jgi:LEA14-like dessication related protein
MTSTLFKAVLLLLCAATLGGCASVIGPVENPRMSISAVRILPASGTEQRIELDLRVLNPNSFALEAKGLVVDVVFNDIPLLSGAAPNVAVVPAYGEAGMTLTLAASLVNGLRLLNSLMQHPDHPLQYRLEARLDLKRPIGKRLRIVEQGEISPRPAARNNDTRSTPT